jgi:hypothetical protein
MSDIAPNEQRPQSIDEAAGAVAGKIGTTLLSEDELLILAAQTLARTYTFDEKDYE